MSAAASRLALSLAVERLERAHAMARVRLYEDARRYCGSDSAEHTHPAPEEMVDRNGRFILLDSLVAIVTAQAVLARD